MSVKEKILIIEDEDAIINVISAILTANGYDVLTAKTGEQGLMMVNSHCPGLVLLDLGLPDVDGTEVLKRIREWYGKPVLIVSARDAEKEKVYALDLGADDYITKPFGTSELLARIRTALRHMSSQRETRYCVGGFTIDFDRRSVYIDGEEIHLTQIEYKIVELLARQPGRVLTYDSIMEHTWGPYVSGDNRILRVNMANIRRKLEKNPAEPQYIFTEIGVGYRMAEKDEEQ